MTIANCLSGGREVLGDRLETEVLLAHVLHAGREFLLQHPEKGLSFFQKKRFHEFLSRRAQGVPLPYIVGHKEFYKLDFYVDERCLIPRPDTELLADLAIRKLCGIRGPVVFDIGTGSGAIAVAVAKNIPDCQVIASDISENALAVAKKNIRLHGLENRIVPIKSDLLDCAGFQKWQPQIIVANLPYGDEQLSYFEKDVIEYEPRVALCGGGDGLNLYRRLFLQMHRFPSLRWLIGEFGFTQRDTLKREYPDIEFHDDLAGIPRAFVITLKR